MSSNAQIHDIYTTRSDYCLQIYRYKTQIKNPTLKLCKQKPQNTNKNPTLELCKQNVQYLQKCFNLRVFSADQTFGKSRSNVSPPAN